MPAADYDYTGLALLLKAIVSEQLDTDKIPDEKLDRLAEFVRQLPGPDRYIVKVRYGLTGRRPLTVTKMCQLMDFEHEFVDRHERASLIKLRVQFIPELFR